MIEGIWDDGRWWPLENEGILDRDRNFDLQQAIYGPLKELLQGFLSCKERRTIYVVYKNRTILEKYDRSISFK